MSAETFRRVADEAIAHGAGIRIIRWGEPFLHPEILSFVKYVKERNGILHITTNGLLLRQEIILSLVENGLDSIIFSMQGTTREEYQKMRNNHSFDKLVQNIEEMVNTRARLGTTNPYIHISCTVTRKDTREDVLDFTSRWSKVVDSVGIGYTSFAGLKDKLHDEELSGLEADELIINEYRACTEVYQKLSVNWNGDITACCADYDNYLLIGNVWETRLQEAWRGETLNKIRRVLDGMGMEQLEPCRTCYPRYAGF